MPSAKGTIVLTGANGGLGSAIAAEISSKPELSAYHGIYLVRDAKVAPALTSELTLNKSSHAHDLLSLDLTNLNNVRQVADAINARISAGEVPPIRALILNAGLAEFGKQSWTDDGFDTTFSANYLGHWLLTLLLLKGMDKEAGRIIVVGSQSHDPNDKRNDSSKAFEKEKAKGIIQDEASFRAIAKGTWSTAKEDSSFRSGFRRYGAAKLFLIMMMHELQARMTEDATLKNICVLGVDPGAMITGLQRHAPWIIRVLLFQLIYPVIAYLFPNGPVRPTRRSAKHVLEAAYGMSSADLPKDLYFNGTEPMETSAESRDAQKRDMVWRETVKYTQLKEGDTILGNYQ